jgi:hypothetical protein
MSALALWGLAGCASQVPHAYVESCETVDYPQRSCLEKSASPAHKLLPGAQASTRIDALCMWNRTGVLLEPGATYEIAITRRIEPWRDARLPEADLRMGWQGPIASFAGVFAKWFARYPEAPMYSLVGAQGKHPDSFFIVGNSSLVRGSPIGAQELLVFANDWKGFYKNNQGCLEMSIVRKP